MALTLVTTEKDLARLRDRAQQIVPFAVTLEFDDRGAVAEVRDRSAVQGAREEDRVGGSDLSAVLESEAEACPPFKTMLDDRWWARRDAPLPTLRNHAQPCVFSAPGKCRCSTAVGSE